MHSNPTRHAYIAERIVALMWRPEDLTEWERARFAEWAELSYGSAKQLALVDKAGERLYGRDVWAEFTSSRALA